MTKALLEDSDILNFAYLTAAFYKFVTNSSSNFEEAFQKQISKNKKNKTTLNERMDEENKMIQEFTKLNTNNYMNYLENLDLVNEEDGEIEEKDIKKNKIELIESVFMKEFFKNKSIENIVNRLNDKMNYSIFNNKNKLMELLSEQTTEFLFKIYEYLNKIIKYIKGLQDENIGIIMTKNLLEEEKMKKDYENNKLKLLNEKIYLKNEIELLNKKLNKKNKMEDKLIEKNKALEIEKSNLKENMKQIQNKMKIKEANLNSELSEIKTELNRWKIEFGDIENLRKQMKEFNTFKNEFEKFKAELAGVSGNKREYIGVKNELKEAYNSEFKDLDNMKKELELVKTGLNNVDNKQKEFSAGLININNQQKEFEIISNMNKTGISGLKTEINNIKMGYDEIKVQLNDVGIIKNKLNDIHGELSQFNKIKNNYNEIINSEDKIQKLNNEIKYINGKLDEFKAEYQHMKSLNIDILLGTVPDLPFKSENKEDLIKHAGNLSPEAEIRGLRRVIKLLFQEYDILEKELADVKKSSKNVKP